MTANVGRWETVVSRSKKGKYDVIFAGWSTMSCRDFGPTDRRKRKWTEKKSLKMRFAVFPSVYQDRRLSRLKSRKRSELARKCQSWKISSFCSRWRNRRRCLAPFPVSRRTGRSESKTRAKATTGRCYKRRPIHTMWNLRLAYLWFPINPFPALKSWVLNLAMAPTRRRRTARNLKTRRQNLCLCPLPSSCSRKTPWKRLWVKQKKHFPIPRFCGSKIWPPSSTTNSRRSVYAILSSCQWLLGEFWYTYTRLSS